jgi:hypothetical protein
MDHSEASRLAAVEKYLMEELPPSSRDEFEQHFFGCQECAADLNATAVFLDAARRELRRAPVSRSKPNISKKFQFTFLWRPAFVAPAFALVLAVMAYQNMVVYPHFTGELAMLRRAEVLTPVSLIGANSRGGAIPAVTVSHAQSILLSVDIPTTEQFSSYSCELLAPSGVVVWRVPVSPKQAKDTVSIRIPASNWGDGDYRLIVQGYKTNAAGEPAELARYRFTLRGSN